MKKSLILLFTVVIFLGVAGSVFAFGKGAACEPSLSQCDPPLICSSMYSGIMGACIDPPTPVGPSCSSDPECNTGGLSGYICSGGTCVPAPSPSPTPSPAPAPSPPGSLSINLLNPLCLGGGKPDSSGNPTPCINSFPDLIEKVAGYITGLIASLAVIIFVYAGFLYLTSAGNEARLGTAKKALLYGIIGVAIALAATGLIDVIKAVIGTS